MERRNSDAQFIAWNDGFKDGNAGRPLKRPADVDYVAGYRYAEHAAFQEYLDSQSNPALIAMERAGDRGPLPYDAEAYDEMVRQDMEG